MHRLRIHSALALAGALGLAACGGGEEASPDAVEKRLQDTLPGLIDSTVAASAFVGESALMTDIENGLSMLDSTFADALPFFADDGALPAALEDEEEVDGQSVTDDLVEIIFTEENYEGDGVYRLPIELFCPDEPADPECVDFFTQAELRLRAEFAGDGLDFTLLVGPDRAAPIALELRSNRASLVGDLAEAAAAVEHLASISGEEVDVPEVFEGVAAVSLIAHGETDVSIEVAIREAIRVEGTFPDVGPVAFSTAAAEPLAAVRLDGVNERLTASYDLARTQLSLPWSAVDAESLATGTFAIDWAGSSATLVLEAGADSLVIENIGFGDGTSTVKLDEFVLLSADFNADHGRRAALTIAPTDALPTFTFDPAFDLAIGVDLSPLADAGDEVPAYLLGESYRVTLDGTMPTMQPVESADGLDGALKIVSGQLTIASSADQVVVPAGECLVADAYVAGENEILGNLAAGACP